MSGRGHVPQSSIRTACDQIVDCYGPKGKAVEKLQTLYANLQAELEREQDWQRQITLKGEIAFMEGYMETPAARIADIKWAQKGIRRETK